MTEEDLEYYMDVILLEVTRLKEGLFTGNVEFKVNFKDGKIGNMNVCLNKSVKQS